MPEDLRTVLGSAVALAITVGLILLLTPAVRGFSSFAADKLTEGVKRLFRKK